MNLFTGEASTELFGGDAPPAVRRLLDQAATTPAAEVGGLLWTAQTCAPDCLAVYYLLYKYHAGRKQLDLAERAALKGLEQAGMQAGLPQHWHAIDLAALPLADFTAVGPARFWLFTLKALAFISLRSGRTDDARVLLDVINRLDPSHSVGGDVIAALLASAARG